MTYSAANDYRDYIVHYGVLGMKWGVRRYRNPDGTLTEAGKRRANRQAEAKKKRQEIVEYDKDNILKSPARTKKYYYELDEADINRALKNFERRKKLSDFNRSDFEAGNRWMNSAKAYAITLTSTAVLLSSPGGKKIADAMKAIYGKTLSSPGGKKIVNAMKTIYGKVS